MDARAIVIAAIISAVVSFGVSSIRRRAELVGKRWDAYADYVVAQQALHVPLWEVPESEHENMEVAYAVYLKERRHWKDKDLYIQSDQAEIRARLFANSKGRKAIARFEHYLEEAVKNLLVPTREGASEGPTLTDAEWEERLLVLVESLIPSR